MRKPRRLATVLRDIASRRMGPPARLRAGLMALLSLLLSGPQGTLIVSAMADCLPVKCMSRDCCCGAQGNAPGACRVGAARCDPAAPFVLTAAEGIVPPPDGALRAVDSSHPVEPAAPAPTAEGHGRRLDRPPRSSR